MVRRRDAEPSGFRIPRVFNDSLVVSVVKALLHPGVEFNRPVKRPGIIGEVDPSQVMDDIAAADDENAFAAQVFEFFTKREMKCRTLNEVEAELDYGDIRCGIHVLQDRPSPMVETPEFVIEMDGRVRSLFADPFRGGGTAGRRILNVEQFLRKPVEVMDGLGSGLCVTQVPSVIQCAETQRTALGRAAFSLIPRACA